jgi:hypothetical protein
MQEDIIQIEEVKNYAHDWNNKPCNPPAEDKEFEEL